MKIGYARCSTEDQNLTAQRKALADVGCEQVFTDHGFTGTNRERPGLDQALAAIRAGDTLFVTKLDRLGRSVRDLNAIADELKSRHVSLGIGGTTYDPDDVFGRLYFNVLAMLAEFESDLIRERTREGMAIAKAAGRLKGKKPKLPATREAHLVRLARTGEHTKGELAEMFGVSRQTVYRALERAGIAA